MEKNYRYAIRKTTLGVGSVAIAAILAGQAQTAEAQELPLESITLVESSVPEEPPADASIEFTTEAALDSVQALPAEDGLVIGTGPAPEAVRATREGSPREGVAKTDIGAVKTDKANSVSADENQISNYRESDLANNGITAEFGNLENGTTKEGVTPNFLEPAAESEDKRLFGLTIAIDRENSERTYTEISATTSGRVPVKRNSGEIIKSGEGQGFFGDVNYPANTGEEATMEAELEIGRQVNFNLVTGEEFLKKLNKTDTKKIVLGWKGEYTQDNPQIKLMDSDNFQVTFSVNPYPNENKYLSIIEVTGTTNVTKVPVQGQYIKTGASIKNLDPEDYDRVTAEVYHPDGTVVDPSEARAILVTPTNKVELAQAIGVNETELTEGEIIFKMPKGALEDPGSIFNNDKFKAIQALKVEFFARPRTAEEFKAIVKEANDISGYDAKLYTETGAGSEIIKHNGQDVTIDKQGIARYDHYNTLGTITINLDDTRYYDQNFRELDNKNTDTTKHTYSKVLPGEEFRIDMYVPEGDEKKDNQKSAEDMKNSDVAGETRGEISEEFIKVENEKIAKNLGISVDELDESQKWVLKKEENDITKFSITAPKIAKPGEFIAVPVIYTYTNGSTDIHWFHFVVQGSNNNKPEYHAEVGFQGDKLTQTPTLSTKQEDLNKNQPKSYALKPNKEGNYEYKDDRGNIWKNIKINENTGEISAVVPENANIMGGENVFIPVIVTYYDQGTQRNKTEEVEAQFIARPKYKAAVSYTKEMDVPFASREEIDESLPLGTIKVVSEGAPGKSTLKFEQIVINGKKGHYNDLGEFVEGLQKVTEIQTQDPEDRLVKVGVKPAEETVTIPRMVEVEVDPTMDSTDEPVTIEEGNDGVVTLKTSRNPNSGAITITKETTTEVKPKKVKVGSKSTGTLEDTDEIPFKYEVEFDPNFYTNYPDATENFKIVTPGQAGSNKKTWTIVNSQKVGDPIVETTNPVNAVIKVGQKDYNGIFETVDKNPIPFEVEYQVDPTMAPGTEEVVQEGELGEGSTTTTHTIKNGQVEGSVPGQIIQTKAPKKKIVKIGAKTDGTYTHKEVIPFEVEVKKVADLKKGEYRVKQQGVAGEKTTTVTIENSKVKGQHSSEITKQPQKHIIEIGDEDFTGEVSHTEKVPVPNSVKIVYNPAVPAGQTKVLVEGTDGSVDVTYTQAVRNGQAEGSLTGTESNRVNPVDRVIEVGTKPESANNSKEFDKQIPVEVEYVYDNTQNKGYVKTGELNPGKVEFEVTNNYENGQITTTEKVKITPAKQKVIVGTKDYQGVFTHETTYETPFDTEVIYDETLESGVVEEIQAGVRGEVKETVTQGFINQNKELHKETLREPKKRIIKVGVKELIKEVPVEIVKEVFKEVPVNKIVEVIKEVPVVTIKEIVKDCPADKKVIEVIREVPVEIIREVPIEVIREVPVEVIREIVRTVSKPAEVVEIIKKISVERIEEVPAIKVRYNKDLQPGQVKVVDPGEKKVIETKNGVTRIVSSGRDMLVEVGCAKCASTSDPELPDQPEPSEPAEPSVPDQPEPSEPAEPSVPDQPEPSEPSDLPRDSSPSEYQTPSTTTSESDNSKPSNDSKLSDDEESVASVETQTAAVLPNTGEEGVAKFYGGAALAVLTSLGLLGGARKKEEE